MQERPLIGRAHIVGTAASGQTLDHIRVGAKVVNRLGGGIGQHADADAGAEHHRKPGKAGKLRHLALFTQLQAARCWPKRQCQADHDEKRHRVHVPGAGIGIDRRANCVQRIARSFGPDRGPNDQQPDQNFRTYGDECIEPLVKTAVRSFNREVS